MSHSHSIEAYASSFTALSRREREIHTLLLKRGPMTDREIAYAFGSSDPNYSRPRCTELIKADWVVECGSKVDPVTGKTVRMTKARTEAERQRIIESRLTVEQVEMKL